jgi:magnesium-transporting ATPase (P-type)
MGRVKGPNGRGEPPGRDTNGRAASAGRPAAPTHAAVGLSTESDGLSSARAQALLVEFGPNTVPEARLSLLSRLVGTLWAPVPWMLEATIVLEVALGRWLDATIVAVVLFLNAALGLVQEGRARSAVALLRQALAVNARVCRDGVWGQLPTSSLVPGDLVHVRIGDLAPADLRIGDGAATATDGWTCNDCASWAYGSPSTTSAPATRR